MNTMAQRHKMRRINTSTGVEFQDRAVWLEISGYVRVHLLTHILQNWIGFVILIIMLRLFAECPIDGGMLIAYGMFF